MHYKEFFKKKIINQSIYNNKLNWFFDIKSILYSNINKKQLANYANQLVSDYKKIKTNDNLKKNKSVINAKSVNLNKIIQNRKTGNTKIVEIIKLVKKLNFEKFFKFFLVHGSVASNDYIYGWSDFDTWVVINNDVLSSTNQLLILRKKLLKFYKQIIKFSKFQHHGINLYTEKDLKNYLQGYLPKQALIKNLNLLKEHEIVFYQNKQKNINLSKKILVDKFKFLKQAIKKNKYDHHVIKDIPILPFKNGDPFLFELFYHIGTILNIPILYLDALGKSSHKKKSFQKFYKIINNKLIINFIKKHEHIRRKWPKYKKNGFNIPDKLIKDLGDEYLQNCLLVYKVILKKINSY